MYEPTFMPIHSVVIKIFYTKTQTSSLRRRYSEVGGSPRSWNLSSGDDECLRKMSTLIDNEIFPSGLNAASMAKKIDLSVFQYNSVKLTPPQFSIMCICDKQILNALFGR